VFLSCYNENIVSLFTNMTKCIPLFKVEPSTKLFPAVFAQATSPNVFQFELGRIKVRKTHSLYWVSIIFCRAWHAPFSGFGVLFTLTWVSAIL
jgi:hypothetical protein